MSQQYRRNLKISLLKRMNITTDSIIKYLNTRLYFKKRFSCSCTLRTNFIGGVTWDLGTHGKKEHLHVCHYSALENAYLIVTKLLKM